MLLSLQGGVTVDWFDKFRAIKDKSGYSIREISKMSDVPEPTLEKLFAGQTKNPGINTVRKVLYSLGHTLDDIDELPPKQKGASSEKDKALLDSFHQLNDEGQELLLGYADTLVVSGKYIKSSQFDLGQEEAQ